MKSKLTISFRDHYWEWEGFWAWVMAWVLFLALVIYIEHFIELVVGVVGRLT